MRYRRYRVKIKQRMWNWNPQTSQNWRSVIKEKKNKKVTDMD
jgi:hypothetical protein